MEGTAGYVVGSAPLQGDEVADDIDYLGRVQYLFYGGSVYHRLQKYGILKYSVYFCLILHYDYNVKNISSLKTRIQIFDKIIVVVWVGLIVLIYFDLSWAVALMLVAQLVLYIIRRRMKKDLNQKEILAKMVEERTAGLRQERLAKAQDELVRKEKMATVGNLTSGLVDRILNPVNYINNFSGLTLSTLQELRGEIDSVRDSIPADKYEDICETLEIIATSTRISARPWRSSTPTSARSTATAATPSA